MLVICVNKVSGRNENEFLDEKLSRRLIRTRRGKEAKGWQQRYQQGETLNDIFNCMGAPDQSRWRHEEPLYRNQFLCSKIDSFVFGLNSRGELIWSDISQGTIKKYFRVTSAMKEAGVVPEYFQLSTTGELQIYDENHRLVWSKKPVADNIKVSTNCLADYDCPYMHLHDKQGKNVLNFRDPICGSWVASGMDKAYDF